MGGRAWQAICSSEVLTYDSIVSLFQNLIAPFGKEHPFSCVPAMLTQAIGRPPFDWPFIGQQVQLLCNAWRCPMSSAKRRRVHSLPALTMGMPFPTMGELLEKKEEDEKPLEEPNYAVVYSKS